jgi:hypothetical protein
MKKEKKVLSIRAFLSHQATYQRNLTKLTNSDSFGINVCSYWLESCPVIDIWENTAKQILKKKTFSCGRSLGKRSMETAVWQNIWGFRLVLLWHQGDRIGRIFAYWETVYLGRFLPSSRVAQFFRLLFPWCNLTKRVGPFFTNLPGLTSTEFRCTI